MEITYLPASQLIESEYNPRKLSQKEYDDIKASLIRFGFEVPILVNKHPERENIIVGGRQRWFITRQEYDQGVEFDNVRYVDGEIHLPCITGQWTRDQERELNIRLNKNTGSWDWELLKEMFQGDELLNWGFEDLELDFQGMDDPEYPDEITAEGRGKNAKLVVTFDSHDDLEKALPDIESIIEPFDSAYLSVSAGEI